MKKVRGMKKLKVGTGKKVSTLMYICILCVFVFVLIMIVGKKVF